MAERRTTNLTLRLARDTVVVAGFPTSRQRLGIEVTMLRRRNQAHGVETKPAGPIQPIHFTSLEPSKPSDGLKIFAFAYFVCFTEILIDEQNILHRPIGVVFNLDLRMKRLNIVVIVRVIARRLARLVKGPRQQLLLHSLTTFAMSAEVEIPRYGVVKPRLPHTLFVPPANQLCGAQPER